MLMLLYLINGYSTLTFGYDGKEGVRAPIFWASICVGPIFSSRNPDLSLTEYNLVVLLNRAAFNVAIIHKVKLAFDSSSSIYHHRMHCRLIEPNRNGENNTKQKNRSNRFFTELCVLYPHIPCERCRIKMKRRKNTANCIDVA